MNFPANFIWGAATAAYQIEGAATTDGKGLSVWDMMCRHAGRIYEGQSGNIACDHYHRYREDVALMKEIGLRAYRFSISWPRVLPAGTGAVNQKGLAFYDRLVDELLAAGIAPWVTLFHWDYPYELYCRGGWLNRASAEWFADYTAVVVDKLSDRVTNWFTLNEPQCFIGLGHEIGMHAPGVKLGQAEILRAAHHTLLAHGRAVQVIRARAKTKPQIGFAPVGVVAIPATNNPADIDAARAVMFSMKTGSCLWKENSTGVNSWWSDAAILGNYPADGMERFGAAMPAIQSDDLKTICQSVDFYGANIYFGQLVRAGQDGQPEQVKNSAGHPRTAFNWPVMPEALYWGTKFLHERYRLPIIITENGISNSDWVACDGKVHDPQRIDFTSRYLRELARAATDGVDVRGYFHWSLMDNFEWAEGYKERFGMIHVDYATQKRTLKESAHWYRDVIQSNGRSL